MKSLFSRFRTVSLVLLLMVSFSVQAADEDTPKDKCDYKPFTLHTALSEAQNTENPLIPVGLPGATGSKNIKAESAITGFAGLLQRVINGLTGIAAAIAVFFIVFNGGGMMLAAGDSEKIKKARTGVIWALVGLLLIMSSYIIAKTVISLTYSGATVAEDGDRNYLDPNCAPEKEETETPPAENLGACEGDFLTRIPSSCYEGDLDNQTGTGADSCQETTLRNSLIPACTLMKEQGDMSRDDECSVEKVQRVLGAGVVGPGFYTDPGAACSRPDGKYGQCTHDALERYLTTKCGN